MNDNYPPFSTSFIASIFDHVSLFSCFKICVSYKFVDLITKIDKWSMGIIVLNDQQ